MSVIADEGEGARWTGGTDRRIRALLLSPFARHRLRRFMSSGRKKDSQFLTGFIEAGQVTPVIDKASRLSEVREPWPSPTSLI